MNKETTSPDDNSNADVLDTSSTKDELSLLKARADKLGVSYSPVIGIEALKNKIAKKLAGEEDEPKKSKSQDKEVKPVQAELTVMDRRAQVRQNAMRLVRIRLTNMNPAKSDLMGDFFAVSNKFIGQVRKFIPYNPEFYVNGYHVPQCILDQLKEKEFLSMRTVKDPSVPGGERTVTSVIKEFAIEELPPLSPEELAQLAADQRARNALA